MLRKESRLGWGWRGVLAAGVALVNCAIVCGTVCRSTKYPQLVLDANVIRNAEGFLHEIEDVYPVSINNSFRSYKEQEGLYQAWIARGKKGNPVAKPGNSRHEAGFAFDLNRLQTLTFNQWNWILTVGERYGFEYLLGDFPGEGTQKFDWPHFQADPGDYGLTLVEALAENRTQNAAIGNCAWRAELSNAEKVYLEQLTVMNPRFGTVRWRDQKLMYLDAELVNKGNRTVQKVELRGELYDSLEKILQVRLLHPVSFPTAGLKPNEALSLHLLFGHVYDFWQANPLRVRVTYVEF